MSNFTFLKADFSEYYIDVEQAEQLVYVSPQISAVTSRGVLENAVNWLYRNESTLELPPRTDLSTLINTSEFKALFNRTMLAEINLVRKIGNTAAHSNSSTENTNKLINPEDALASLKYLFRFLRFIAIYYGKTTPSSHVFNDILIPHSDFNQKQKTSNKQEEERLNQLLSEIKSKILANREFEKKIFEQAKDNALLKQQLE